MSPIYLHIGTHKTGTTSLQKFLTINRRQLAANGLLYPETGCSSGAHHEIAFSFLEEVRSEWASALIGRLADEMKRHKTEKTILSSEVFCRLSSESISALKKALAPHQVTVIVYLRRQDHYLLSEYAQQIKNGDVIEIGSFIRKYELYCDYAALLDRWDEVFGAENMRVRTYREEMSSNQLFKELAEILHIETEEGLYDYPRMINTSPDWQTLSKMEQRNDWLSRRLGMPKSWISKLNHGLLGMREKLKKCPRDFKGNAPRELSSAVQEVLARQAEANRKVIQKYLSGNGSALSS